MEIVKERAAESDSDEYCVRASKTPRGESYSVPANSGELLQSSGVIV